MATSATVTPRIRAISSAVRTVACPPADMYCSASSARADGTAGAPGRYLPVRKPLASTLCATRPRPSCRTSACSRPSAWSRARRLYSSCTTPTGTAPDPCASASASSIRSGRKPETPTSRALPSFTRSDSAATVSSSGVRVSSRWACTTSTCPVPRRRSEASTPRRMDSADVPGASRLLPTFVPTTRSSRQPRAASQPPMIASDSPPAWPGTHCEYEDAVSTKVPPSSR